MTMVSATELQNNFGKYLQLVQEGGEIIVLRNGKEVARLISAEKTVTFLTDSIKGVLQNDTAEKTARSERITKYEDIG